MKTTQEKIENKISDYFAKEYDKPSDYPKFIPDNIKLTRIMLTTNGDYYVEGKALVEICIDDYDSGKFDAILDKHFNIKEMEFYC